MSKLEGLIEDHLVTVVDEKWKKIIVDTGICDMQIPEEYVALMRIVCQISYQEGHSDLFVHMKDIYYNDVDGFIGMFEDEEDEEDE